MQCPAAHAHRDRRGISGYPARQTLHRASHMPQQILPTLRFVFSKPRLLANMLVFAAFAAGFAAAAAYKLGGPEAQALLTLGAGFFGIGALVTLPNLLSRRPALVLAPSGICIPGFAQETVPWSAVRDLGRFRHKSADTLVVKLDQAAASRLTRGGLWRLLPKSLRGSGINMTVPLHVLKGNPDAIMRQCVAYVSAARVQQRETASGQFRAMPAEDRPQPVAAAAGRPVFTFALMALLALVYGGELVFGVDAPSSGAPSVQSLAVLGGVIGERVWQDGEWWRLATAPLLHADLAHIGFNGLALWLAGALLERLVGWRWFAAIFAVSALGGALASLWINGPDIVGVGASGGVVGLFAAAIVASFHFPVGASRSRLQVGAMQILIPSLLPVISASAGLHIDYAAHFGGAVAGGLLAALLLRLWPNEAAVPRFGSVAATLAALYALAAGLAIFPIIGLHNSY